MRAKKSMRRLKLIVIYSLAEWFSEKHKENDPPGIEKDIPEVPSHASYQEMNITKLTDHSDDYSAA